MISKNSPLNVKYRVKPIAFTLFHKNAYQGPCRYGEGYALSYEYDVEVGKRQLAGFKEKLFAAVDTTKVELLEPVMLHWCEDFVLSDELYNEALKDDDTVDFYLIYALRISNLFIVQLAQKTDKPFGVISNKDALSRVGDVDAAAKLHALGKEVYSFYDYPDMMPLFEALRVKKALAQTKIFFPLKGDALSAGCQSSFMSLDDVSNKFGVSFKHVEAMDVLDGLDVLTAEQKEAAAKQAKELHDNAKGCHLPLENTIKDMEIYQHFCRLMDKYDCNAFTIPCFEVCATRELMRRGITFCSTHSLNHDRGIPSACASDVGSLIAMEIAMMVSNKAPYMGNTMVRDIDANLCRTLHDVPSVYMKGFDNPLPYELVSFTLGNWGTTFRYNFDLDKGETITAIAFTPDFKKMMISTGVVDGCDNYLVPECKLAMRYTVKDARKFYEGLTYVGHHMVLVYGDYAKAYREIAKVFGMEVIEA